MFSPQDKKILKELSNIFAKHLGYNDKRVVNAVWEAFELLYDYFNTAADERKRGQLIIAFERIFGFKVRDLVDEFYLSCLNSAQYERAVEFFDKSEQYGLLDPGDARTDRAELLSRMDRFTEAEALLTKVLEEDPDNIWTYIALGDVYYTYPVFSEKQNYQKAEQWYYQAFDRELHLPENEGGLILLQRLGDVCLDRLREKFDADLARLLQDLGFQGEKTLFELKQSSAVAGFESVLLNHIQREISNRYSDLDQANRALQILTTAYNFWPQEELEGLCPAVAADLLKGKEEQRIQAEMFEAYERMTWEKEGKDEPAGARWSEGFSRFQDEFMSGVDDATGVQRRKLIKKERRKREKLYEKGELVWMGFLDFREN